MNWIAFVLMTLVGGLFFDGPALAQSNLVVTELSLQQSIDLALKQNPAILKARQEIRRTHGVILEAHSYALPQVNATGQYTEYDPNGVDKFPFGAISNKIAAVAFQNQYRPWTVQIEASQTVWSGGRIDAGIRSAKLSDQIALLGFDRTVADTVLDVRKAYYQILLDQQQVVVREQSTKLLSQQLEDTRRRFDVGDVPRFNVLRAEVELANAKPPLIRAQNDLRLARETLVKLLAIDTFEQQRGFTPITFSGQLTYEPRQWELSKALEEALAKRPELQQAEKTTGVTMEDIRTAQAGNRPQVSIFGGFQVHDSEFGNDVSDTRQGWIVGAQASWDIFDGMLTKGKISEARARREQALFDLADTRRSIELEVRQAYSDYLQAIELLEAQKKTVEEAEESLRLAEVRFRAGSGTQLDVLSAQTALTEARSDEAQALYDYNVANATLERATGNTVTLVH